MAGERKLTVILAGDHKGLTSSLDSASKSADGFGSKLASVGKAAALGFAAVGAAAIVGAKQAIDAASNLNETLSKSNTVFKESAGVIEKWADGAAKSFGQSKQQALEAASSFGNMFIQLGIGADKAAGMSTQMTELASDFASFHNADITEVIEAQSAAFRGEYDSVQKFVPTINAAAVEQKALAMGLKGTTKELTAQDKALATQQLLLEGAGDAMGDYDRTSGSLANKQRELSATFEDIKAKIGTALIPVASALAGVLADKVLPAFEAVGGVAKQVFGVLFERDFKGGGPFQEDSPFIASLFNFRDRVAEMIPQVQAVFQSLVEWFQANWPKIQEVVTEVMTTIGSVIAGAIEVITVLWDNFGNNILEFVQRVWPAIQQIISGVLEVIRGIIQTVTALIQGDWSGVWEGIKQIFRGAWEAIQGNVKASLEVLRTIIGAALEIIGSVIRGTWDGIVSFIASIPGRFASAAGGMWNFATRGLAGILDGAVRLFQNAVNLVITVINAAIEAYNKLPLAPNVGKVDKVNWTGSVAPSNVIASGPNAGKDPHHLAEGGIVKHRPGGVYANIGEGRYDEAVIPLKPGMNLGGGPMIYIENQYLQDGRDFGDEVDWLNNKLALVAR